MSGFDLDTLRATVTQHGHATRILVLATKGSVPRGAGTAMLVTPTGQIGTIGGGALEWQAVAQARDPELKSATKTIPLGPDLGQCCGGSVVLLFERFTPANLPPDAPGFARPITKNPSQNQPLAIRRAQALARSGQPADLACADGWLWEPVAPSRTPLWLFGAGHVGRAVIQTLHSLPFDITWIDTHSDRFPPTFPSGVTQLIAANPADVIPYAPPDAQHIVMTFSHALDLDICAAVLTRPHAWLGLIGSATKAARFRKRLAALGCDPARLTCPIGDPSLGKEPAAIAIGLASDLLKRQKAALTIMRERSHA